MNTKKISVDFDLNFEAVENAIVKKAEEALIKKVRDDAETIIFEHRWAYDPYRQPNDPSSRTGVNEPIIDIIKEFMNDNKEEIIKRVSDNLTKRLAMSKGYKDLKEA